jgi:pyruvate,water dikinase
MTDVETRVATWEKPGPGTWELDSSHAGAAPTLIQRELYTEAIALGMKDGFAMFGAPLSHMEMRWIHGKLYRRLVPLVGGSKDLPPPPMPVLWLVTRLHPAMRRAERTARSSFATKRWRDELDRWEREWKPDLLATNRAFTAVDLASLDAAGLAEHLQAVHRHLRDTTRLHFRLHVSDLGPLGILMMDLEDWGLRRDDSFRALVAASPATRGPAEALRQLAATVLNAGVDPASLSSLDDVRSASPEARRLLDEYLAEHGWRVTTGYGIDDRCLVELPDAVVASIRAAATSNAGDIDHERALAELREQVPAEHRAELDEAVEDARLSYGLRDENGPLTYEWPAGLLRRALLEAARRLEAGGALDAREDVFELRVDEIAALLEGRPGPGRDEIAERAATRRWEATLDPPDRLGREEGPPPLAALTPYLAKVTRLVLTAVSALEADPAEAPLTGLGIGAEPYVGTARVVHDAAEALADLEPGDVVVTPYTAPTYNSVLAMAGAIITEEGGLLCHAAVIARELGLPAVIGAQGAMAIPNGATVEVDPKAGRVRVL